MINVFEQIVADRKREIELGLYTEHQKLSSCRDLAMKLGINPNTVQKAYAILEEEGYIYSIPKKGVFVSPRDKEYDKKSTVLKQLNEIKNAGVSKDMLLNLIDEIYGDSDDTNK